MRRFAYESSSALRVADCALPTEMKLLIEIY